MRRLNPAFLVLHYQLAVGAGPAPFVVGDRWTMLILKEAFMRVRRFEDFLERTGAPRPVLSDRLRTLVDNGVLEKRRYRERPCPRTP